MNITDTMAGRDLDSLRAAIAGQVFVPGEVGYDQARQAWNLAVDQQPALVVEAGSMCTVRMRVVRSSIALSSGSSGPAPWPVPCGAIRIPWARANRTAWAASAADPASTTKAGCWSTARFHACRAWS